jgi:hypothetical protein
MSTKINVIITENYVYATYVETICYRTEYKNEDEMWVGIQNARSVAFGYSCDFGNVTARMITNHNLRTDNDIFEYLKLNK